MTGGSDDRGVGGGASLEMTTSSPCRGAPSRDRRGLMEDGGVGGVPGGELSGDEAADDGAAGCAVCWVIGGGGLAIEGSGCGSPVIGSGDSNLGP